MYLWFQVIHENCEVGGVVTETWSDTRTGKGHPAAVAGPVVGAIMPRRSRGPANTHQLISQRNISIFKLKAHTQITATFPFVTHIMLKFQKAQTGLLLREYFI